MDLSQTVNANTGISNQLFEPRYISIDYVFNKVHYFFTHLFNPFAPASGFETTVKFILAAFSIFFIFVITYSFVRILEIRKREHEYFHHEIEEYRKKHAEDEIKEVEKTGSINQRWDIVLQYLFSASPGEWRLAIIEADSMLEDLMNTLGFKGEGLGEKLKSVDRDKYPTLVQAWEAHIVRNKIAHEGDSFQLSHQEAKRIISIYEQIFKEFRFI